MCKIVSHMLQYIWKRNLVRKYHTREERFHPISTYLSEFLHFVKGVAKKGSAVCFQTVL